MFDICVMCSSINLAEFLKSLIEVYNADSRDQCKQRVGDLRLFPLTLFDVNSSVSWANVREGGKMFSFSNKTLM